MQQTLITLIIMVVSIGSGSSGRVIFTYNKLYNKGAIISMEVALVLYALAIFWVKIIFFKMMLKSIFDRLRGWLGGLSFRTGVVVLLCCVPCYVLSFAQMALPISVGLKGVLWFVLFGMAKTFQYAGLGILGVEGVKRLRKFFRKNE